MSADNKSSQQYDALLLTLMKKALMMCSDEVGGTSDWWEMASKFTVYIKENVPNEHQSSIIKEFEKYSMIDHEPDYDEDCEDDKNDDKARERYIKYRRQCEEMELRKASHSKFKSSSHKELVDEWNELSDGEKEEWGKEENDKDNQVIENMNHAIRSINSFSAIPTGQTLPLHQLP
jgi:hypothetical protein